MPAAPVLNRLFGLLLLACAMGFLAWASMQRVERANFVSATDAAAALPDTSSPTGYADARRWLIVPEHHSPSYERIMETQQMFATGTWRVRHVDYDNAPEGRPVYSSSAYRWWLATLAWLDSSISDRPLALSVERVAVWSEPLLHAALLLAGSAFVARWFGWAAAAAFAFATAFLFPFAGSFLPAVPDDRSLARICVFASVVPLLAAFRSTRQENPSRAFALRGLFMLAGFASGVGLWVDAPHQTWIILGTALGAVLSTIVLRTPPEKKTGAVRMPWRAWALTGAVTSTVAYLADYAPSHLGLRLEVNHPVYALAWAGLGELLTLLETRMSGDARGFAIGHILALVASLAALATLPIALAYAPAPAAGWLSGDLFSSRLTNLPNAVVAPSLASWLQRDGLTGSLLATLAPLLVLVPAILALAKQSTESWRRRALALTLGMVLPAVVLALTQLDWWATVDVLLISVALVLLAPAAHETKPSKALNLFWGAYGVCIVVLGVLQLRPAPASGSDFAFTPLEVEALLERGAAHWIADRAGPEGAVVLLPAHRTTRWCFHGGPRLRGVGSTAPENRSGLTATLRIATAQTGEEAQALLAERAVTHLVLPSWDEDLRQFATLTLDDAQDAFITAVHEWSLPSWLRPVPYPLPEVTGFEDAAIVVLQITDETNRPAALARMVEYFLETNQAALADAAGEALRRFPSDPNALVALAQLQKARADEDAFKQTVGAVVSGLSAGFDRGMAWDRRVSLAVVLAQAERHDLATEQVKRCIERLDTERMLSLTTGALYRLQALAQAYDLPIQDAALRERARALLPEPLQERLRR